jgi:hypothetical protein
MEGLTPPLLHTIRELRWRISTGLSMREALRLHLESSSTTLAHDLREWWALKVHERNPPPPPTFSTPLRRAVLDVIERGLAGQPSLEHLQALEEEVERAAQNELDAHISSLPFKVLLPLLLFQFPAFLILLLGPLLRELNEKMGG